MIDINININTSALLTNYSLSTIHPGAAGYRQRYNISGCIALVALCFSLCFSSFGLLCFGVVLTSHFFDLV